MKTYAIELIHLPSIGNLDACRAFAQLLKPIFKAWYADRLIKGWELFICDLPEKASDCIPFLDYEVITGGRFPFVFIALQEFEGGAVTAEFVLKNDFARLEDTRFDREF